MSKMSDFSVWIEEILVSRGWDIDDPEVQWCINKHQGYLMSMYAGGCPELEVSRAFANFWHRSDAVLPDPCYQPGDQPMKKNARTQKPEKLVKQADIWFYRANEKPYGAFSNLFRRPIEFAGRVYPTAEHAYQAGKARKDEVREWILSAPTPSLVAMAAHGLYTWDIVPEWSRTKFARMREVLHAKFTQHEDLKNLLLSTGNARLVEAGRTDNAVNRTWGEVNGKGQNMLGVLLMEVREAIRAREASVPKTSTKKAKQVSKPAVCEAIHAAT